MSNSLDWGASRIEIDVHEDRTRRDNELVITIQDDGEGLTEERLQAFFDLGNSPAMQVDEHGQKIGGKIGEKGHGTKIFFSSRQIEIESQSSECLVDALMEEPLEALLADAIPDYNYDIETTGSGETYTKIVIRGYDNNNKRDFAHAVLKDYLLWFTKFGSVEQEFGLDESSAKVVLLHGLGRAEAEEVRFGHRFAPVDAEIGRLRTTYPGDWPKYFVKKWVFKDVAVRDYPGISIDFVLYLEGDQAKRQYNSMIRGRGRAAEAGMYKVEDRYGLYACKDHIPIQRHNEWISLGQAEWTKYHAFVNCQAFRVTANRGDIANTPREILEAVGTTVRELYEEDILQSKEFQEYEEQAELEERYRDARQEGQDFKRRQQHAMRKRVVSLDNTELLEPRQEAGVLTLFTAACSLRPNLFPFQIVDYDTKRGYDALAASRTVRDLSREALFFIEFKHQLKSSFDHSFAHLIAIVCWDCPLGDGAEVTDIANKARTLRITAPESDGEGYTKYMLVSPTEQQNVEVFVLKDYLAEKLGLEFRPRASN